ncbi:MAG: AAA family ATPase [Planctomycetota bacterium]
MTEHHASMRGRAEAARLRDILMRRARPDVRRLVSRHGRLLPEVAAMAGRRRLGRGLLDQTQRLIDRLAARADEFSRSGGEAWWSPRPAVTLAALFRHTGYIYRRRGHHAHFSALLCRTALRRLGLPFAVRCHAEDLLAHVNRPMNLVGSDAPPEAYMALACRLDTRALYHLKRAEMDAEAPCAGGRERDRLELFAATCRGVSAFGTPPDPEPGWHALARRGLAGNDLVRTAGALRYLRIAWKERDGDALRDLLERQVDAPGGRLHLPVGAAGCGKSTWVARNLPGVEIISTDAMRETLTGDPADQSRNYEVFQRCRRNLSEVLSRGSEAVFDATNFDEDVRETPVSAAREAGAEIWTYFFDVPLGEALRRNRSRSRRVPPAVIHRHWRSLSAPAIYESDRCFVVDARGRRTRYWPS